MPDMNDKEFLQWIYDRLVMRHKEDERKDYMMRFRNIINEVSTAMVDKKRLEDLLKYAYKYVVGDIRATTNDLQDDLMNQLCELVGDYEFQRFVADDIVTDFEG